MASLPAPSSLSMRRWNFTPSPGWTVEETRTLRLLLMRYGIGRWVQILATGLLPGKLIQQLYGATQRLLGQQSLAAFTGLRIDLDRVRAENEGRTDAPRKSGLIIYDGRECWVVGLLGSRGPVLPGAGEERLWKCRRWHTKVPNLAGCIEGLGMALAPGQPGLPMEDDFPREGACSKPPQHTLPTAVLTREDKDRLQAEAQER